jgi:hypothetical protein
MLDFIWQLKLHQQLLEAGLRRLVGVGRLCVFVAANSFARSRLTASLSDHLRLCLAGFDRTDREQGQAQIAHLFEQAVQRGLIANRAG